MTISGNGGCLQILPDIMGFFKLGHLVIEKQFGHSHLPKDYVDEVNAENAGTKSLFRDEEGDKGGGLGSGLGYVKGSQWCQNH